MAYSHGQLRMEFVHFSRLLFALPVSSVHTLASHAVALPLILLFSCPLSSSVMANDIGQHLCKTLRQISQKESVSTLRCRAHYFNFKSVAYLHSVSQKASPPTQCLYCLPVIKSVLRILDLLEDLQSSMSHLVLQHSLENDFIYFNYRIFPRSLDQALTCFTCKTRGR